MITEFHYEGEEKNGIWLCNTFYSKDFPIDLKIGDEIWMYDFKDMLTEGEFYTIDENETYNKEFDFGLSKVTGMSYGKEGGEIIKILSLELI